MITNYLSPLEFKVIIHRMPNVEFFTQRTSIPSISANPVIQPTRFNPLYQTPDTLTYSNLDISFIIDENMKNYMEVHKWLTSITFPQNHEQYPTNTADRFSDISIIIMNSKKNPNIIATYKNCFPISLSEVTLDTTQTDVTYPEASMTIQYDYFEITNKSS
jgi:hypothetical protein